MHTTGSLDHEGFSNIPHGRVVTCTSIAVDYCTKKKTPVGGSIRKDIYPAELTTRISDLITPKTMWNSVIGTPVGGGTMYG